MNHDDDDARLSPKRQKAEIEATIAILQQIGMSDPEHLASKTTRCRIDYYESLAKGKKDPKAYIAQCILKEVPEPSGWRNEWERTQSRDDQITDLITRSGRGPEALEFWANRLSQRTEKTPPQWTLDYDGVMADPSQRGAQRRRSIAILIDQGAARAITERKVTG